MLKFLENRPEDTSPKRSPKAYQPSMSYGNSYQSPTEFQTPHTIFHPRTYINPFLKFEPKRAQLIPLSECLVQPKWTHKVNLSLVEEQKAVGVDTLPVSNSRFLEAFGKELDSDPRRFRINRGQFTDFIDKHSKYKLFGPLQGVQRTTERIKHRQQLLRTKSFSKRNDLPSLRYASSLSSNKSTLDQNPNLLAQKLKIRRKRERIKTMFECDLSKRKKENTSVKFQLPRTGPQHQIWLLETEKSTFNSHRREQNSIINSSKLQEFLNSFAEGQTD